VEAHRLGQDLRHHHPRVQRRIRILEDHLHAPAQRAHLGRCGEGYFLSFEIDRAGIRIVDARDQPGQRGFAAA
jgi:hypothetical protein